VRARQRLLCTLPRNSLLTLAHPFVHTTTMSSFHILALFAALCCVPSVSGTRTKVKQNVEKKSDGGSEVTVLLEEAADTWSGTSGGGCPNDRESKSGYCVKKDACGEEQREGWIEASGSEERRECFTSKWGMTCASTHKLVESDCVACTYDAWTDCSKTCGAGTQTRSYENCDGGQQEAACNTHACPVDCVGEYGAWGACSLTCGGGSQSSSFKVTTAASIGGKSCPASTKTQDCNTDACLVCATGHSLSGAKCVTR